MEPLATTPHDGPTTHPPRWLERAISRLEDDPSFDRLADSLRSFAGPVGHGEVGDVLRGRWLGHALHPMLTDLPIGCWTSATLLDVVGGARSRDAAQRLIGLGLLCVPVTAAAGLADWSAIRDDPARRVGAVHAALNVAASACYLQSWRNRRRDRHWRGVGWGMAGGAVASASGYLGGHLSFGGSTDDDQAADEDQIDLRTEAPAPGDLEAAASSRNGA